MNISQSAKRIVFCCTFTAGGLQVQSIQNGLRIVREGKCLKFVKQVAQVSFHGPTAVARGQKVLYVTERAVFELTATGLRLVELADGIDLSTQIIELMEFQPLIGQWRSYNRKCFQGP